MCSAGWGVSRTWGCGDVVEEREPTGHGSEHEGGGGWGAEAEARMHVHTHADQEAGVAVTTTAVVCELRPVRTHTPYPYNPKP